MNQVMMNPPRRTRPMNASDYPLCRMWTMSPFATRNCVWRLASLGFDEFGSVDHLSTMSNVNYVSILHDVVFAFEQEAAGLFEFHFGGVTSRAGGD